MTKSFAELVIVCNRLKEGLMVPRIAVLHLERYSDVFTINFKICQFRCCDSSTVNFGLVKHGLVKSPVSYSQRLRRLLAEPRIALNNNVRFQPNIIIIIIIIL